MEHFLLMLFLSSTAFSTESVPTLINGRIANLEDFPASVWTRGCSATVVGEQVVFIAAHCVTRNTQISFSIGANRYTANCSYSGDYSRNKTADYALCATSKPVVGILYEKINVEPNRFNTGDQLLLTGYGCTRLQGQSGGNDGTYRIGESTIQRLPREPDNDIYTSNGAALCPGDSGGPAFYIDSRTRERYVTSANSRVDNNLRSYLPATYTAQATSFFKSWTEKTGKKICGYHSDAIGCRGENTPPKNDTFSVTHRLVNIQGKVTPGNEHRVDELKNLMIEALLWAQ